MRLTAMRNDPKWTIFVSGGLELLQMASEPDTGQYASEDTEALRGVNYESVREENRTFVISV